MAASLEVTRRGRLVTFKPRLDSILVPGIFLQLVLGRLIAWNMFDQSGMCVLSEQ